MRSGRCAPFRDRDAAVWVTPNYDAFNGIPALKPRATAVRNILAGVYKI
jgi:hypothetical protein